MVAAWRGSWRDGTRCKDYLSVNLLFGISGELLMVLVIPVRISKVFRQSLLWTFWISELRWREFVKYCNVVLVSRKLVVNFWCYYYFSIPYDANERNHFRPISVLLWWLHYINNITENEIIVYLSIGFRFWWHIII